MLIELLFLPRKRQQLIDRNRELRREIKKFSLRDSCLSPNRDTAAELEAIEGMKREIKFNRRLMNTLAASYILAHIGIRPRF
jgi:hypothetical protein